MMSDISMRTCSWLAAAVLAVFSTNGNASEASPEDFATLGMRLILQQDDDSIVRFYAHITGRTEQYMRENFLGEVREGLDANMAAAAKEAGGGQSPFLEMTEALRRISCAPVLPGKAVEHNPDGSEDATVLMRCMIPEIRHIEAGPPPDTDDGELIPGTSRSWTSYLEDLKRPATVPVDFTWTLKRNPSKAFPRWIPYPSVFEIIQTNAYLAISPVSVPGGTVNFLHALAGGASEDDDVAPRDPEDE